MNLDFKSKSFACKNKVQTHDWEEHTDGLLGVLSSMQLYFQITFFALFPKEGAAHVRALPWY